MSVTVKPLGIILAMIACGAGCRTPLALQFKEGEILRYRFVSDRDIAVHWELAKKDSGGTTHTRERMDLVMAYEVTAVEPNGCSRLRATCESIDVRRTRVDGQVDNQPDAVEGLAGRSFDVVVNREGRYLEHASLEALIKQIAETAFRQDPKQGRVKAPEMIWDFITTQWFLWETLASAEGKELEPGATWSSRLAIPTPWVSRKARDVTYTVDRIEPGPQGKVAAVISSHNLSPEKAPRTWPIPYAGRFRQSGTFGFLMGHKIYSLSGTGEDRIHLTTGQSEGYRHEYRLESQAFMPLNMSGSTKITIEQIVSMEKL